MTNNAARETTSPVDEGLEMAARKVESYKMQSADASATVNTVNRIYDELAAAIRALASNPVPAPAVGGASDVGGVFNAGVEAAANYIDCGVTECRAKRLDDGTCIYSLSGQCAHDDAEQIRSLKGQHAPSPVQVGEVRGWLHEIRELGEDWRYMLSQTQDNPWSHWMQAHLDKCEYKCTPLYATPQAPSQGEDGIREALEFYANPEIYKPHPHGPAFDRRDLSYVARAALDPKGKG